LSGEYLLPSCPLHPLLDLLSEHETHKTIHSGSWKCSYCGKMFGTESYVDNHLYRSHKNEIPKNATTCLADYCGIFGCENIDEETDSIDSPVVCNDNVMLKRKYACQSLMQRCFPPQLGDSFHRLNELFNRQYCGVLTCKNGAETAYSRLQASKTSPVTTIMYYIVSITVLLILFTYYLIVCIYQRDRKTKDMERLAAKRHSFLKGLYSKPKLT